MFSDFERQLTSAARRRMSPELGIQYARLDDDAQLDIALILLSAGDRLPSVLGPEHLPVLREAVDNLLVELRSSADLVS